MKERLRRVPVVGTALRMQERYVNDAADTLAAAIGFFGFLSLFPLLALLLAVVGQFFADDVFEQQRLIETVQTAIPGLAALVGGGGDDPNALQRALGDIQENTGSLFGIGTVTLLFSGLRIANGAQQASAVVFRREVPSGLGARVTQLGALAATGTLALAGAAVGGSVGVNLTNGVEGLLVSLAGIALAFVLDVALFSVAYRLFTPGDGPAWSVLLPGAMLAAAGWVALKLFGATYVTRQAQSASNSFGAVGSIIALLALFYLAGRLYVYGAELSALLAGIDGPAHGADDEDRVEADATAEPEPRPAHDVQPDPADVAKLAASTVLLGAAGGLAVRLLGGRDDG